MRRTKDGTGNGRGGDVPFLLLGAAALAAPPLVLAQGGDAAAAWLAAFAVLGTPAAAIEAMLGLARLVLAVEGARR